MPRGDFLPDIILPPDGLRDAVQLACHPLAPLISIAVRTLSAACVDGWVPTNHLSPSVVLCTTGTVGGILKLTPKKVEEVISAMEKGGLFETRDDGAKRMADQVKIAEAVAESNVRNARRESRRKSRSSKISNLDAVCLTKRGQCLTNGKTTEDIGTASSHNDAPVQTVTDQDRHYLGIPSGCFRKRKEIIQDGGCGGKDGRLHLVVNPEPAESRRLSADDATLILKMAYTRDKTPTDWPMERRLCVRMLRLMVIAKPNRVLPTQYHMKKWENDMRLLLQDRNGDHAAINSVLKWALEPGSFWAPNIASPSKLRAKFDQVEAQMEREQPPEPVESFSTTEVPRQYTQVVT